MSVIAGAVIAPRMPVAVWVPPRSPLIEASVTSDGTARERSRRACSQSKRDVRQILDGLDAAVDQGLEVGVRLESLRLRGHRGRLGRRAGQLGLAVLHRVAGQHVGSHGEHAEGENTEHDERAGAGGLLRRRPRERDP